MTWSTRYADDDAVPFLVDDGTGRAYVDPDGADLVLSSGDEVVVEAGETPPENISRFLERETSLGEVGSRRRRYKEARIAVGDPILVAGHADPSATPDDHAATSSITAGGDASTRFYVTDDPSQGVTRRLLQEVLVYLLVALLLFSAAGYLYVT